MWGMLRFLRLMPLQRKTPATSGPFDNLPLEITQHIASCLPVSAAAAFALCNHYLCQAVGTQYWMSLREPCEKEEWQAFLQLLDRDMPDHLFCHRCARLHLPTRPGMDEWKHSELTNRRWERQCFKEDSRARAHDYFPVSFGFEHIQMAMKFHRLKLDVKKYLGALACVKKKTSKLPNLEMFEARIVSDEMITRTQHWSLMPVGQVCEWSQASYPCLRVCPHLDSFASPGRGNILPYLLYCRVEHIRKGQNPCGVCTGLKQCQYCPTEMQIDVKVFEGRGIALVVTKWLAVGTGMSPSDPKWRSHLYDENHRPVFQRLSFKAGSIQKAFEQPSKFDFESPLTPKIEKQLLRREAWTRVCYEDIYVLWDSFRRLLW